MSEPAKTITFDESADKDNELRKQSHGQVSKKALKEVSEKARMEVKSRYSLGALQAADVVILANSSGTITQNVLKPIYLFVNGELKSYDERLFYKNPDDGSSALFKAMSLSCEAKWDSSLLSAGQGVYDSSSCENWPLKGRGWDACILRYVETYGPWRNTKVEEPKFQSIAELKKKYAKCSQLNRSFFRKKEDGDPRRIYLYRSAPAPAVTDKKKGKKKKGKGKKKKEEEAPYEVFLIENSKDPERMLERCSQIMTADGPVPLSDSRKEDVLSALGRMEQKEGMVIGLSMKNLDPEKYHKRFKFESSPPNFPIKDGYTFLGMLAARDLPRADMQHCFRVCRNMRVKVIVASAYLGGVAMLRQCQRVGYITDRDPTLEELKQKSQSSSDDDDDDDDDGDLDISSRRVKVAQIDGYTIDELDEEELDTLLSKRRVIVHRSRRVDVIVDALHRQGKVVAVVGGSFDTSALSKADVGISGGVYSAKRSKKTADIILKDSSFTGVVRALSVVRPYEGKKGGLMGKLFGKKKKKSSKKNKDEDEDDSDVTEEEKKSEEEDDESSEEEDDESSEEEDDDSSEEDEDDDDSSEEDEDDDSSDDEGSSNENVPSTSDDDSSSG